MAGKERVSKVRGAVIGTECPHCGKLVRLVPLSQPDPPRAPRAWQGVTLAGRFGLTEIEVAVGDLSVRGIGVDEIARRVGIKSPGVVRNIRTRILNKVGAGNIFQLFIACVFGVDAIDEASSAGRASWMERER
jgi:hypothetical protein